jgi:prephenate dehydrogenase
MVEDLWQSVGARTRHADPETHDQFFALSSHLPQVTATALGRALARSGIAPHRLGPGGRDTTRLAASDPALWTDILLDNADQVGPALETLLAELHRLARAVADGDADRVQATFASAREWTTGPRPEP